MRTQLYTIYDSKAETYGPPLMFNAPGEALRYFDDLVNGNVAQGANRISLHPEDYTLFSIGRFDVDTGTIEADEAKVSLGNGIDYVSRGE